MLVLMVGANSFGGRDSVGKPETVVRYRDKYGAFLHMMRAKYRTRPILCITPILTHQDIIHEKNKNGDLPQAYRDLVHQLVEQHRQTDRSLYFLDRLSLAYGG